MFSYYDGTLQSEVRIIYIGEYWATGEGGYISTVVGSCIAVALYDSSRRLGGLNHFMLPEEGRSKGDPNLLGGEARYGMGAMEFLINELMKLGSRREELSAKVFGGGHILHSLPPGEESVPEHNIAFARTYLKTEGIPVTASDVGDTIARKIFFNPQTAEVLLKRITGTPVRTVEEEEREYLRRLAGGREEGQSARFF